MARTYRSRSRGFFAVTTGVCILVCLPGIAWADDGVSEGLRANESGQQQIQTQAQELAAQLRAMSAEFERNGLAGDEVKTLDQLSASIGTMSGQDMAKVINLLRQARTIGDQRAALQQIAAAYAGQKNLTVEMKSLLARYQKDQVTANVAATVAKLSERQASNLQTGIDVANWTQTKKTDTAAADLKAALDVQGSEQSALRDEAKLAADRLQAVAKDAADPPAAARAQAALGKFSQLNATLDQAGSDLKDGHLFKALTNEKTARDSLRQLARELKPAHEGDADSLRQADHDLKEVIAQQKEMLAQTQKVQDAPDMDTWLKKEMTDPKSGLSRELANPKSNLSKSLASKNLAGTSADALKAEGEVKWRYAAAVTQPNSQTLAALEAKANDLADRSDLMSQDLQKNAAQAAASLKSAQEKTQAERADLDDHDSTAALQDQQAALAAMEQAQKQIQAQIAAADAAQNADRLTQLQAVRQQERQLAATQTASAQQQAAQPQAAASNAAQEANLKNQAQALQDKAAQAQSPAAASALQQAANQMQKAADALKQPNGQPQAQAAEAAAAAEMQKADQQLEKDIAQTAAAQQQLQEVSQALAALEKVIAGQTQVQTDTTSLATRAPGSKGNPARGPGAGELASRQAGLKSNTAAIVPMLATPDLKPAAAPLTAAQDQMAVAQQALSRANAVTALDPQRVALTDLLQAKELLNAKKSELQQQTDPAAVEIAQSQQTAQAAEQIAQAQAQAQAAQQQLVQAAQNPAAQTPAAQAAATQKAQAAQQSLDNAANLAGQAAANSPGALPDAAKQSLANAQKALNQAASAAAKGDQAQAQAQTQKGQEALAQAQAQSQAAQAGLAQADNQSGSPPGASAPGTPGQAQPGSQPGQSGQPPGQAAESAQPSQDADSQRDPSKIGQGDVAAGSHGPVKPASAFAGLPPRDRAALQQSQSEKYPQEYGAMIEQYLQNLADQPGS